MQLNAIHAGSDHVQGHLHMGLTHFIHGLPVECARVRGAQGPAQIAGRHRHRAFKLAVDLPAHVTDLRDQGRAVFMHRLRDCRKGLDRAGQIARDALRPP